MARYLLLQGRIFAQTAGRRYSQLPLVWHQGGILTLAPLLALYVLFVLVVSTGDFQGDESRYVWYAENLTHGYYSPTDSVALWNSPGYPFVLLPFALLQLPWLAAKMLNPLFMIGAVIYLYYTLRLYMPERAARYFSYLVGIYPPAIRELHLLAPETLTFFLTAGLVYHVCRLHQGNQMRWTSTIIASIILAFLAMTKVIFGYVILAALLFSLVLYLWRKGAASKKLLAAYSLALLLCIPYLYYTYSLTGKVFYWGHSGGMQIYWMSTPYEGEFGDWFNEYEDFDTYPQLAKNHQAFHDSMSGLGHIEKDDALRKQAIINITQHPEKYLQNWTANVGRLLFSYPYSYTPQKLSTYFYIIPNMFIVVALVLCAFPAYRGRRLIPYEIRTLLLFGLIAFFGSSLLAAYQRHFTVLLPFFVLWVFFTLTRILRIEMRA